MNNGAPLRFLLPLCALLSGCGESAEQPLEQVSEKTYAVNRDASFSIKNGDGSIRVYGSDKPEMKVQAIRKAYSGERLNKIAVNVSVRPGSVSIETRFPPKQTWGFFDRSGTVDYIIVVPKTAKISHLELANGEVLIDSMQGEDVHANLTNGRLFAHNCFGDLHLAVMSGGLDVIYDWWEQRRFSVEADIVNGNARAFIPGDASFHLVAEALSGKIANDFGGQKERNGGEVTKIDTVIGTAAASDIKIRATDGNIKIVETNR
jgi:DUF4097 and DUF4098 domain-containing protein YvlB